MERPFDPVLLKLGPIPLTGSGAFWTALGVVFTVAVSWWFARGRKGRLTVGVHTINLIGGPNRALPDAVTVLFADKPVPRLYRTRFILVNNGQLMIHASDVVRTNPPRITFDNCEFLECGIARHLNPENAFRLEKVAKDIHLGFDFCRRGEGVSIDVLHAGPTSPAFVGTLKEAQLRVTYDLSSLESPNAGRFGLFLFSIIAMIAVIFVWKAVDEAVVKGDWSLVGAFLLTGALVAAVIGSVELGGRYFRRRNPVSNLLRYERD